MVVRYFSDRLKYVVMGVSALLITACASHNTPPYQDEGPQLQRVAEAAVMADFEACRSDAMILDGSARKQQSTAQYLSAARSLDRCLSVLEPYSDGVDEELRMQLHALSVLDFLKGGDVVRAHGQFDSFQFQFPGKDLYFADNTSFVDTLSVLLGSVPADAERGMLLNVNPALRSELNRSRHWSQN